MRKKHLFNYSNKDINNKEEDVTGPEIERIANKGGPTSCYLKETDWWHRRCFNVYTASC